MQTIKHHMTNRYISHCHSLPGVPAQEVVIKIKHSIYRLMEVDDFHILQLV